MSESQGNAAEPSASAVPAPVAALARAGSTSPSTASLATGGSRRASVASPAPARRRSSVAAGPGVTGAVPGGKRRRSIATAAHAYMAVRRASVALSGVTEGRSIPDSASVASGLGDEIAGEAGTTSRASIRSAAPVSRFTELLKQLDEASSSNERLRMQVKELEKDVEQVRKDRDNKSFEATRMMTRHAEEIEQLESQINEMMCDRSAQQDRLARVERLENAINDLFVEMNDRNIDPDRAQDYEMEERRYLSTLNPLMVIEQLRGRLKVLADFRRDYENELRSDQTRRKTKHEGMIEDLQRQLKDQESNVTDAMVQREMAVQRMKAAQVSRDNVVRESEAVIGEIRHDNARLIRLVRSKDEELSAKELEIQELLRELRDRELKLGRVTVLETELQSNKVQHATDLQRAQFRHGKTQKLLEKERVAASKTVVERNHLKQRVKELEEELRSHRRHKLSSEVSAMRTEAQRLGKIVSNQKAEISAANTKCRAALQQAEAERKKNKKLHADYEKLLQVLAEKQSKESTSGPIQLSPEEILRAVDANPAHVSIYKQQVREREREIDGLRSRLKKAVTEQQRLTIAEKTYQAERAQLEDQLARYRSALQARSNMMSSSQPTCRAAASAAPPRLSVNSARPQPDAFLLLAEELGDHASRDDGDDDDDDVSDGCSNRGGRDNTRKPRPPGDRDMLQPGGERRMFLSRKGSMISRRRPATASDAWSHRRASAQPSDGPMHGIVTPRFTFSVSDDEDDQHNDGFSVDRTSDGRATGPLIRVSGNAKSTLQIGALLRQPSVARSIRSSHSRSMGDLSSLMSRSS